MTPDLGRIDPALIRQAFIDPIRTVMLIDDRFPTLTAAVDAATGSAPAPPNDAGEWQRAGRLWRGCRKRQWICDTEHRSDWSKDDIACIAGSDLIVLDYHLEGEVDTPAVASCMLLRDLAAHSHTNLVVVYTSDPNLDNVRNEIVAGLRGHLDWKAIIRSDDGQLERAFNIFKKAVTAAGAFDEVAFLALCSGDETWCTPLRDPILRVREQYKDEAAVGESWGKDWRDKLYAAFAEHHLEEKGAHLVDQVESVRAGDRWVECGNVFVTLMTKPDDPPDNETETLVQQLEEALIEWKPSGMRAAVALARAEVRRAGLRGEALSLPEPMLEAGWWYSMLTAKDGSDQSDRARQIATDLLAGVSDVVADKVGSFIAGSAPSPIEGNEDAMQRARALAVRDGERSGDQLRDRPCPQRFPELRSQPADAGGVRHNPGHILSGSQ
jgi:hypothetical protein